MFTTNQMYYNNLEKQHETESVKLLARLMLHTMCKDPLVRGKWNQEKSLINNSLLHWTSEFSVYERLHKKSI
jgi:hypothetical protein